MQKQEMQQVLDRFRAGHASETDRRNIEQWLEAGEVGIEDLEVFRELEGQLLKLETPPPSAALDRAFYRMLSAEKRGIGGASFWSLFSWPAFAPKLALASAALLAGLAAGYLLRPASPASGEQVQMLSQQVSDLQEMMMLSWLENGSATERLKAVNLTQEMSDASRKVTRALIQTLNQDENVNVRLAALEALKPYATDSSVREALIRSIAHQESPLVQMSLAELMVALQEKSAVSEFEKIVESDKTPAAVKEKLKESIRILI